MAQSMKTYGIFIVFIVLCVIGWLMDITDNRVPAAAARFTPYPTFTATRTATYPGKARIPFAFTLTVTPTATNTVTPSPSTTATATNTTTATATNTPTPKTLRKIYLPVVTIGMAQLASSAEVRTMRAE